MWVRLCEFTDGYEPDPDIDPVGWFIDVDDLAWASGQDARDYAAAILLACDIAEGVTR